jgi:hypothetical protein
MIMKKRIIILLLTSIVLRGYACNSCGADISSRIYPSDFSRFLGFAYSINAFKGKHGNENLKQEYYHRTELFVKYLIKPRLEVMLSVPYSNIILGSKGSIDNHIHGLGDISIMGRYAVLDSANSNCSQRFALGAGLEMPTGSNRVKNNLGDIIQPFQPGSASWDLLCNANYAIRNTKYAFVADANYKWHTANSLGFKRPNILNLNVEALTYITIGSKKIAPKLGLGFDQSFKAKGNDSTLSFIASRSFVTGGVGLDVYFNRYFISSNYRLPIYQTIQTTQQLTNTNYRLG